MNNFLELASDLNLSRVNIQLSSIKYTYPTLGVLYAWVERSVGNLCCARCLRFVYYSSGMTPIPVMCVIHTQHSTLLRFMFCSTLYLLVVWWLFITLLIWFCFKIDYVTTYLTLFTSKSHIRSINFDFRPCDKFLIQEENYISVIKICVILFTIK